MAVLKKVAATFSCAGALLSGCSNVSYLFHAGMGQWSVYNHERPVDEVLKDSRVSEKVKEQLRALPQIREFVENELGVKSTSNYKTYVDLKRPYVSWALSSAEGYELKAITWRFPFVGSFPYLGFFNEKKALKWEEDQRRLGRDTHVRGVAAYSTLGYLRDPLLSSMLTGKLEDLVNLLFHESTHTHFYIKEEGTFNEQAASYIGDYGERLWIEQKFGLQSKEMRQWVEEQADRSRFALKLRQVSERLKRLYEEIKGESLEIKTELKLRFFEGFRVELLEFAANQMHSLGWKNYLEKRFIDKFDNNAILLAHLTYEDNQEIFAKLHQKCRGSLKGSLAFLKRFSERLKDLRSTDSTVKRADPSYLLDHFIDREPCS